MALRLGKKTYIRQLGVPREDRVDALKDVRCPSLIIAARQDQLRPLDNSRELATHIPNASLTIVEDCGHMIPLEKPQHLLRAIREWVCDLGNNAIPHDQHGVS